MILTIRRSGGFAGLEELLGTVDAARLDPAARQKVSAQLENLADLTSGHEPIGADGYRYEVDIQGPGQAHQLLALDDEGDPEHPAFRALRALMRTLGLPPP